MAMASTSSSTGPDTSSDSAMSRLGGIEDLKLKVGPVRRNLFGPVDHQQLRQDFQRLLCMSVEVANKRWNFDFQSDMPGKGSNIEWEELKYQEVPAFYHSCMVRTSPWSGAGKGARQVSPSSGESSPRSSSSSGSGDEYHVTRQGYYRLQRPRKRKQSTITDFFKVKKRKLLHYKGPSRQ